MIKNMEDSCRIKGKKTTFREQNRRDIDEKEINPDRQLPPLRYLCIPGPSPLVTTAEWNEDADSLWDAFAVIEEVLFLRRMHP